MIHINSKNVLKEPQIVEYLNNDEALYALSKFSLLYKGLQLWCHLYNQRLNRIAHIARQDDRYIYFRAHVPLTKKDFSNVILSNIRGNMEKGYATGKFVKYLNKRYKALYTRDLFNVVQNVTPDMTCPYAQSNKYYANLRTKAMIKNIKRGILKLDYSSDPYASPDIPDSQPSSYHEVVYHNLLYNASELPFEQINKNTVLYRLVKLWTALHQQTFDQVLKGFEQDSHYIYFGMTNIPRSNSWKYHHPNHYSDVDYFLLGGSGNCETMKQFINWARTSSVSVTNRAIKNHNVLHISRS